MALTIGIDLGGTRSKLVLLQDRASVIASRTTQTPVSLGFAAMSDRLEEACRELFREQGLSPSDIDSLGLAVPGPVRDKKGPVLFAPNLNWYQDDPVSRLEEGLGIPVLLGNDADCMALAESRLGAGKDVRSLLLLTLGTAVGGALVNDGELFTGFGPYGGELGHIPLVHGGYPCSCGLRGCFEQYGSAEALKRFAREALESMPEEGEFLRELVRTRDELTPELVFEAAASGDPLSAEVLDLYVTYLCEGMAGLTNIFRPDLILLGGGLAEAGDALFERVQRKFAEQTYISEFLPAPPVRPVQLGIHSGAIGAALLK